MLPPILRMDRELVQLMVATNTLPPGDLLQTTERALASAVYRAIDSCSPRKRTIILASLMTPKEAAEHEVMMLTPASLDFYNTLSREQYRVLTRDEDIMPYRYDRHAEPPFKLGTKCKRCKIIAQTATTCCGTLLCLRCMRTISRSALQSARPPPGVPCPGCKEPLQEEDLKKMGRPGLVLLKRQQEREVKHQRGPDGAPKSTVVFCHERKCRSFVGSLDEQEVADALVPVTKGGALRCVVCWARTCVVCRGPGHSPGIDCPMNEDRLQLPQYNARQAVVSRQETTLHGNRFDNGVFNKMPYLRGCTSLRRCWTRRFWHEGLLRAVHVDSSAARAEIIDAFLKP